MNSASSATSAVSGDDVLNNVLVLNIECRIWSGRKKLRAADLPVDPASLPPEDLISLGSKKIFDPKALRPFTELKGEMNRRCAAIGFRFAKNYAIPRALIAEHCKELDALIAKGQALLATLVAEYEVKRQEWKQLHPDHAHIIDSGTLSREQVKSKFFFGYEVFAINGIEVQGADGATVDSTPTLVSGLAGRLYVEVAKTARQLQAKLVGRDTLTNRFLNPVRALQSKLSGLSFLDPGISPMVVEIGRVLASMPNQSAISGNDLLAVRGLLSLLADPKGLKDHAKALGSQAAILFEEDDEEEEAGDTQVTATDASTGDISNAEPAISATADVGNGATASSTASGVSTSDPLPPRSQDEAAPVAVLPAAASVWDVDVAF